MNCVPYLEFVKHNLNKATFFFLLRYPSLVSLLQLFFVGLHHRQLTLRQLSGVRIDGNKTRNSNVRDQFCYKPATSPQARSVHIAGGHQAGKTCLSTYQCPSLDASGSCKWCKKITSSPYSTSTYPSSLPAPPHLAPTVLVVLYPFCLQLLFPQHVPDVVRHEEHREPVEIDRHIRDKSCVHI